MKKEKAYSPIRAFIQDCVVIENDKLGNERVSPKNTVSRLPKKHRLILAYDTVMHWLIVMDLETGQRIKQDAPDCIINTPDFNYEKNNNELLAVDRKELIKGLQTSKDDYVFIQYNEDLKSLCDKAHKLDMKIVLDAVFNHTGNDSKYFNEYGTYPEIGAYQSLDSIYSPFFRKHEENGKIKYDYWWGMKNLPECDGNSIEWINYITGKDGIIDKWFSLGIDGLRLDVADELTDNFIKLIRKAVKRNKQDGFIIGEVWKNPMRMNREYISSGQEMDSVMNYVFIDALLRYFKYADVHKLSYTIKDILNEYPEDTIKTLMNFTSTHDITRAINLFASNEFDYYGEWAWNLNNNDYNWCKNYSLTPEQYSEGKKIYETYVFTLNFLPGILSIFYGDEIGMQGMGNLSNRKPYPKENYDTELLNFFKHMGKIRTNEPFLKEAELEIQDINEKYFVYERSNKENKILVAVNRSDEETSFPVPKEYKTPSKVYTLKNSKPGYLSPHGAVAIKKS